MPYYHFTGYLNPISGDQGATLIGVTLECGSWAGGAGAWGVSVSGSGVTANSVVSTTPGVHYSNVLTFNLVIDPGAATGARDILVTFPDGWVATMSGAFTVNAGGPPAAPTDLTGACAISYVPTANFSMDHDSGTDPLTVAFTDTSTGSPDTWLWEFGDGTTDTSQNPSHDFTEGIWQVRLTASNSLGSTSVTKAVIVTSVLSLPISAPIASFTADHYIGTATLAVAFTDTSTGSPTSWAWDFGDGNTSSSQNPSHSFTAIGVYTVKLTATNAIGSTTATKVIIVTSDATPANNPPTASITASETSGIAPLTVAFSASADTTPAAYLWDFGDGVTSALAAPTHIFTSPGNYLVQLTVTNTYGSTTSSIMIIVAGTFLLSGDNVAGYYLIDRENNVVLMFTNAGAYIGSFGGYGSQAGKFNLPTTLVVIRADIK